MKERIIVQTLIDTFIEVDGGPPIVIMPGMRKTGKTTILKQLYTKYKKSSYIDCTNTTSDDIYSAVDEGIELLLLDEFTHLNSYETFAETIYNKTEGRIKIIITGSSPVHLMRLARGKLGGGRSKIFKVSPITFIEYLYFTDKISSYSDLDNINNKWFIDYLKEDGLPPNLKFALTDDYIEDIGAENIASNNNSDLGTSIVHISREELLAVRSVFSYKLSEMLSNNRLLNLEIGAKEKSHLIGLGENSKILKNIDLTDAIINDKYKTFKNMTFKSRINVLFYLLDSCLASIVINRTNRNSSLTINNIINELSNANKYSDVIDIVENISIQLTSPFFYMVFGKDIFNMLGYDLEILEKGMLTGYLLEVYVVGDLAYKLVYAPFSCDKLQDDGEVDVFINQLDLLMELSVRDKKNSEIALNNYFKDSKMLRILSTNTKNNFSNGIHRISYGKLLCMLDNNTLFKLSKTDVLE